MNQSIAISLALLMFNAAALATPLGTEFRYTGFLTKNGNAAPNGYYDFMASLYDANQGGIQKGALQPSKVPVTNGVFQLLLDFGAGKFDGTKLWLQLSVVTNGMNNWTLLSPRQLLTATPYALFAPTADSANNVANNAVTGPSIQTATITASKIASGEVVKSLNGLHDDVTLAAGANVTLTPNGQTLTVAVSGGGSSGWALTGNSGTTPGPNFLGTLDNQPLEMQVHAARALRLEPAFRDYFPSAAYDDAINVIGGYRENRAESGVIGATIAGGGDLFSFGTASGSLLQPNIVVDDFGSIGGGYSNRADYAAVVGGGHANSASRFGFIGGGDQNWMDPGYSRASVIGGGSQNQIQAGGGILGEMISYNATIGGGVGNIVGGNYATVPGGYHNFAAGESSFAAGERATASHDNCFVWSDGTFGSGFSTGPDQFVVQASGGARLSDSTDLYFGATGRQMIHLWGDTDGIGVQNRTIYFRTGGQAGTSPDADGFAWYAGGSHVDPSDDPGPAGVKLMSLRYDSARIGGCGGPIPTDVFHFLGAILDVEGEVDVSGNIYLGGCVHDGSDRNSKENFTSVNSTEVLERVVSLPITRWNYKKDKGTPHIGPMAQDFYAAFSVGPDEKHISNIDEGGVALAAIQALNQKLEEQSRAKSAEIQTLKQNMSEMRQLLEQLAAQMKREAR